MRQFWMSWYQPTEDYRPLKYPPNLGVLAYWCSGSRLSDDAHTLVAWVIAPNVRTAKAIIRIDWPEADEWRLCEELEKSWWPPSNRFPIDKKWEKDRIEKARAK